MTIVLIAALILSFFVSQVGRKREMGPRWSFFFCFFFSPLLGYLITITSHKISKRPIVTDPPNFVSFILALIYLAVCGFLIYQVISTSLSLEEISLIITLAIGFFGSALYVSRIESLRWKGDDINDSQYEINRETVTSTHTGTEKKERSPYNYTIVIYWVMIIILLGILITGIILKGI